MLHLPGLATRFPARLTLPPAPSPGEGYGSSWLGDRQGNYGPLFFFLFPLLSLFIPLSLLPLSSSSSFFHQCRSFMDHLHWCWGRVGRFWVAPDHFTSIHLELTNPAALNFHQVESQDRLPRSKTCRTVTIGTGVGPSWTAAPSYLQCPLPSQFLKLRGVYN